jgi:hypothetical protein
MLRRPEGDLIELFYFKTEAIQTYDILLRLGYQINVMVIQEHGFGGTGHLFAEEVVYMTWLGKIINSPNIYLLPKGIRSGQVTHRLKSQFLFIEDNSLIINGRSAFRINNMIIIGMKKIPVSMTMPCQG